MSVLETFQLAIKNILSSKMRTFLTMLGIIIGVCAVIVIVGLGNGMQMCIRDRFPSGPRFCPAEPPAPAPCISVS